jgi:hypothetical protein
VNVNIITPFKTFQGEKSPIVKLVLNSWPRLENILTAGMRKLRSNERMELESRFSCARLGSLQMQGAESALMQSSVSAQ